MFEFYFKLRGTKNLSFFTWKGIVYGNFNTMNLTPSPTPPTLRITDFNAQAIDANINSVN